MVLLFKLFVVINILFVFAIIIRSIRVRPAKKHCIKCEKKFTIFCRHDYGK